MHPSYFTKNKHPSFIWSLWMFVYAYIFSDNNINMIMFSTPTQNSFTVIFQNPWVRSQLPPVPRRSSPTKVLTFLLSAIVSFFSNVNNASSLHSPAFSPSPHSSHLIPSSAIPFSQPPRISLIPVLCSYSTKAFCFAIHILHISRS